jgi:choice-of-anchor B domain-containing protein
MKKIIIVAFALILFADIFGQCLPVSSNMTLLDSWDNPLSNREYSDVWGYVASDGTEYAIIGDQDLIYIVDVSDPTNINLVQTIDQEDISVWRDFKVYGDFMYSIVDQNFTFNNNGVVVYDLSGLPTSVTKVREMNMEFTKGHNVYVDEKNARLYAVGVRGSDMCVYDLVNPGNPQLMNCYDLDTISDVADGVNGGLYIHDIFVKDNIAYCSHGYAGYGIWDMNDVENVSLLGYLESSFFDGGYVHSSWNSDDDNHAVVATELGDPKLFWVDQSNLNDIKVLSRYKEPLCPEAGSSATNRPHNPYIIGDKIYTSLYHDGLHVLEIDFEADTLGRVGYYDTYPDNSNYNIGFEGNWGAYPYLPSGTILASDITYGLFTLKYDGLPTYTFLGPGTDWDTASNWYNGEIPPSDFTGSVIISKSCTKTTGESFPANAKIVVNTGATFIQE